MVKARTWRRGKTTEDVMVDIVIVAVLAFVVVSCLYPFYLSVILSFNEGLDAQRGGIYLWVRKFTLSNYASLLKDSAWLMAFGVTVARTAIGTALTVAFTMLVSYGLSHRELMFRKAYFGFFIFAMYFSGGVIPYYILLRSLHLLNTFWVYVIPGCLSLFYILVATSFFEGIPAELGESAKLDGAGEGTIFLRIILPLSKPLMATIAIFTSVAHWNSWYETAFFTSNKALRTVAYQMITVINKTNTANMGNDAAMAAGAVSTTSLSIQLAAMVIAVLPILCVYPFFQQYFVTGLTVGAVKS
ncbi:MAG: carbohydrate ABC transporter permease [Clostridia bacterium]|nr:carbohydrate ABC transporter permease [Clostridia bacterium]